MPELAPRVERSAAARQPRGLVKLNDEIMAGWTGFEVENTIAYQADTFRVTLALSALPKAHDAAWLSTQSSLLCEIWAGFPQHADPPPVEELDRLILGQVDEVNLDPVAGTVELSGRDLTARLIDTKVTENWLNHTASDIARQMAQRHGLAAQVTATHGKMGSMMAHDTVSVHTQSEWDLLTRLAGLYQYQVYVQGHVLHFAPPPDPAGEPYVLHWQAPADEQLTPRFPGMALSLTRALTVAQGVTVIVQSCLPHHKRSFTVQYPTQQATGTIKPGRAQAHRQIYRYTLANQTQAQALRFAQAKHREITQHERRLSAVLPADHALSMRRLIRLDGTGTDFDQRYYPESVRRRLDLDQGYRMHLQAKNTSSPQEPSP